MEERYNRATGRQRERPGRLSKACLVLTQCRAFFSQRRRPLWPEEVFFLNSLGAHHLKKNPFLSNKGILCKIS